MKRIQQRWIRLFKDRQSLGKIFVDFFPGAFRGTFLLGFDVAPACAGDDFSCGFIDAFQEEDTVICDVVLDVGGHFVEGCARGWATGVEDVVYCCGEDGVPDLHVCFCFFGLEEGYFEVGVRHDGQML